jgi:hypothetical protein
LTAKVVVGMPEGGCESNGSAGCRRNNMKSLILKLVIWIANRILKKKILSETKEGRLFELRDELNKVDKQIANVTKEIKNVTAKFLQAQKDGDYPRARVYNNKRLSLFAKRDNLGLEKRRIERCIDNER